MRRLKTAVQNDAMNPIQILRESIRYVPAVKYGFGVGGIVAVVAVISLFKLDFRVAIIGSIILILLMGVLLLFSRAASLNRSHLSLPAQVLIWFALICFMGVCVALIFSVFFDRPLRLSHLLVGDENRERPVDVRDTDKISAESADIAIFAKIPPLGSSRDYVLSKFGPAQYVNSPDESGRLTVETYEIAGMRLVFLYENGSTTGRAIFPTASNRHALQLALNDENFDITKSFYELHHPLLYSVADLNLAASWGIYTELLTTGANSNGNTSVTIGVCENVPPLGLMLPEVLSQDQREHWAAWRKRTIPEFYLESLNDQLRIDSYSLCDWHERPNAAVGDTRNRRTIQAIQKVDALNPPIE